MNDFFVWFLSKHQVAAALVFPELSMVWALWMRQYSLSMVLMTWVFLLRSLSAAGVVMTVIQFMETASYD